MRDELGVLRREFPHTLQCVAGTQVEFCLLLLNLLTLTPKVQQISPYAELCEFRTFED